MQALAERIAELPLSAVVAARWNVAKRQRRHCLPRERNCVAHRRSAWRGAVRRLDWAAAERTVEGQLWKTVQSHPSAVVFPGETARLGRDADASGGAVREWNARLGTMLSTQSSRTLTSSRASWRMRSANTSTSFSESWSIRHRSAWFVTAQTRPFVERINDTGGSVAGLKPTKRRRRRKESDRRGGRGGERRMILEYVEPGGSLPARWVRQGSAHSFFKRTMVGARRACHLRSHK